MSVSVRYGSTFVTSECSSLRICMRGKVLLPTGVCVFWWALVKALFNKDVQ